MFQFAWKDAFEIIFLIIPSYHILVGTLEQSQSMWNGLLLDETRLADAPQECTLHALTAYGQSVRRNRPGQVQSKTLRV